MLSGQVRRHRGGFAKLSGRPGAVRAGETGGNPCQRGHDPARSDAADAVVEEVRHEQIPLPVHCDADGTAEFRVGAGPVGEALENAGRSGDGAHHPTPAHRHDFANRVNKVLSNKEIAVAVNSDAVRSVELGVGSRAVRGARHSSGSGNGAHHPIGSNRLDFPDDAVAEIRHIKIAQAVHGHALRIENWASGPRPSA